ncbi:hypothetical protein GWI33_003447 [Rhynchophorus ferrugineus]|uniref:DH domain-containing protein n=1 Tax=Rhynchophorus ferrugineus TaxID=354439 RepID=A0A834MLD7_RHYFE|nr:hypothetical protein GWI33_003447 [Rhynchophorus ferrugineus]
MITKRIQYILEELLATEENYVKNIKRLLTDYYIFLYEYYPEEANIIFGNLKKIYQLQISFLETLESCGPQLDGILEAFIDYEKLFKLYPIYMRNVPKANATVKILNGVLQKRQVIVKDKFGISAYLIKPIQRLANYKLFFENIIKELYKVNLPTKQAEYTLSKIKRYMSEGDDALIIHSIEKSPIKPEHYGLFIMKEKFTLLQPEKLNSMRHKNRFTYYKSIYTNDLQIVTFDDKNQIHLTDFGKKKRRIIDYTFVLDAKNAVIRKTWNHEITNILLKQLCETQKEENREGNKGYERSISMKDNFKNPINDEGISSHFKNNGNNIREAEQFQNNTMIFQYSDLEHRVAGISVPTKIKVEDVLEDILKTKSIYVDGIEYLLKVSFGT